MTRALILGSTLEMTLSAHSASTSTRSPRMSAGMLFQLRQELLRAAAAPR